MADVPLPPGLQPVALTPEEAAKVDALLPAPAPARTFDWFDEYMYMRDRAVRAEAILRSWLPGRDIGRAEHIRGLEEKCKKLAQAVRTMQVAAEKRNRDLAASNLVVYCSGGCYGGVPNPEAVTEELVKTAERNVARLREWWTNRQSRLEQGAKG